MGEQSEPLDQMSYVGADLMYPEPPSVFTDTAAQTAAQQEPPDPFEPFITYAATLPSYQIVQTSERDSRILYMRKRFMTQGAMGMPYNCSQCMSTATPHSLLADNWTPSQFSTFGRRILTFHQPHHMPDEGTRIRASNLMESPDLRDTAAANTLRAPYITFFIMMGEITFAVMTPPITGDIDITQSVIPPIVLVEVANFVRDLKLNIEVLQLSIYQTSTGQDTVLLPFNNNFVQGRSKIKGKICHRFIIPTVITEWIDYTQSPMKRHYALP